MIPAVHPRGTNVGGLLRYLFGPGKREEHVNPRLIATWDSAGTLTDLQPPAGGDGRRDVRPLTELLEQPVTAAWNPPAISSLDHEPAAKTVQHGAAPWNRQIAASPAPASEALTNHAAPTIIASNSQS
jgi:hypothetical protein